MELDATHREIDELKSAMEKLTAEYTAKSELSERLRIAHDEQSLKFKEAKKEIEKHTQELYLKSGEINLAKKMYEDLQSSLREKESVVKCLTYANDQLRTSTSEKLMILESQNRELASALDEANYKVEDKEKKLNYYEKEVAGLRNLLSDSQKRCSEAEMRTETLKEVRRQEETFVKLEQECAKMEEQLKWKNERFKHLEEAYKKLQEHFNASKMEWEAEKTSLVDEIISLQGKLDSQTRVVEDLNSRLKMSNQALAHEESRRKMMEIQVSELRASYENVATEYEEVRSEFHKLMEKRDEDIAAVRNLLTFKESLLKETEFHNVQLQQDNNEMKASLKEFQVAQINEVGAAAALKDLRMKFKYLEQAHENCAVNLKEKEYEWSLLEENLENDLEACMRKFCSEKEKTHELQLKLEDCLSSMMHLKAENDEMSIIIMVIQSRISELNSRHRICKCLEDDFELKNWKSISEQANMFKLNSEVDMKYLIHVHNNIKRDLEVALLAKSESEMNFEKEKLNFAQEIEQRDRKVEALREEIVNLKEVFAQEQLEAVACVKKDAMAAFDKERERFQKMTKEKETTMETLSAKLKLLEQDQHRAKDEAEVLQNVIFQLRNISAKQQLEAVAHAKERDDFQKIIAEKDKSVERLDEKLKLLDRDCARTKAEATRALEEKAFFLNIKKQKDMEIVDLQKHILSQEKLIRSVETAITLQLADMQFELSAMHESWEKIAASHLLDVHEKEFKSSMIHKMEEEFTNLKMKLAREEKQSSNLKKYLKALEQETIIEKLERKKETSRIGIEFERMKSDRMVFQNQITELCKSLTEMQENSRLLIADRENLVAQIIEVSNVLGNVCHESGKLMQGVKHMVSVEDATEFNKGQLFHVNQSDQSVYLGCKDAESRSPLKERNSRLYKPNGIN